MFLILICVFFIILYIYGTKNYNYWSKKGIKFEKPIVFFGGSLRVFIDKVSLSERFAALYRKYPDEKFVGFYDGRNPAILIRDPELVKHVLINDFRYFHKRGLNPDGTSTEPLLNNIFAADGDVWKLMRQKLTTIFSSGKLKAMFPLIVERTKKLEELAYNIAESNEEVDVRELLARHTTDVIGVCGFGIDSAALDDKNSDFWELGKRIVTGNTRDHIVSFFKMMFPEVFKFLHFVAPEVEKKIYSFITQIMSLRNHMPSGRRDFIDLMMELKQKGNIIGESIEKKDPNGSPKIVELELDDQMIAAHVLLFFAAGFDTSSSASSFLLHKLAYYPEVQARCQKEVDEVFKKYDGKLCFDAIKEMKYLEMALQESMRLLPSPGFLQRKCVSKYTFPGTGLTLDKDTYVFISTEGLSSDKKFFDEPEEFRPERFHPANTDIIKKCTFMPFGDGPRSCIGERMGIMQSMAGAAVIIRNFTLSPSRSSVFKPLIDPTSDIVQNIIGGLPLALTRRNIIN